MALSLVSLVLASFALSRSGDSSPPQAGPGPSLPPPTAAPPTDAAPTATTSQVDGGSGGVPTAPESDEGSLDPDVEYPVTYQGEKLTIIADCDNDRYIDLDEPRAGSPAAVAEFLYDNCTQRALTFAGSEELSIATVDSATATSKDCLDTIRTEPAVSPVVPAKGLHLCVLTSAQKAHDEGTSRKLVLLTIDDVSAANGTLTLTLTAWEVVA